MASSLGEAVIEIGADTSGFEKQTKTAVDSALKNASKSVQNMGRNLTGVGTKVSLGITAPVTALGLSALNTAAQFETSMNLIKANLPNADIAKLSGLAKQLGADTVFSANEAADAMLELAKGGFKQAQIAGGGIQATMALAATEGLALADSATIVGNSLNAFGLKAKQAVQVTDALAAGSAASSASVASLAEGLGNVGATAKQSGLSIQDTVTALAILDNNAIRGAEGGTALRSFLTALTPTSKRAQNAIDDLGLSFQTANGDFRSLGDISQQLQNKLGRLSEAQRAEALQTIFGSYAKQAAAVFLGEGAKGFDEYTKAVNKSGVAQKLADARMKGTAGAIERMKGSIETALLNIGQAIAPTAVTIATFVGDLADKFSELSPKFQKVIIIVSAVAAAMGPLLVATGLVISSVGTLGAALGGITLAVAAPIAAIVAVVAAIGLLLYKSQAARDIVMAAFLQMKTAVAPVFADIANTIQTQLIPALIIIAPYAEKVGLLFLRIFSGVAVNAIKTFVGVLAGAVNIVTGIVRTIAGVLTGDWAKAWDGVKQIFKGSAGIITAIVRGMAGQVKIVFTNLWPVVVAAVSAGVRKVVAGIKKLPGLVLAGLGNLGGVLVNAGEQIIDGFLDGIQSKFNSVKKKLGDLTDLLPDWKGPAKKDKTILFKSGQLIMQGLTDGMTDGAQGVKQYLTDLTKYLKQHHEKAAAAVAKSYRDRAAAIGSAMASVSVKIDEAQRRLDDATSSLTNYRDSLTQTLKDTSAAFTGASSAGSIVKNLTKQDAALKSLISTLAQLRAAGLNTDSYNELAQQGVGGLKTAQALLAGGTTAIAQVNQLQKSINSSASQLGTTSADYLYKAGVTAAQGILDGLKKQQAALDASMERLGKQLANAVTKQINATTGGLKSTPAKKTGKRNHANGTTSTLGGTFMAGERGPELITAPARSRVYTAQETARMADAAIASTPAGNAPIEINQNYYGPQTGRDRLKELEWTMRYATSARNGGSTT